MKKSRTLISLAAFLLAMLMLSLTFVSCDNGSGDDVTDELSDGTDALAPESLKLTKGGKAQFNIVRPDDVAEEYFEISKEIANELKKITGVDFEHATDFMGWNTDRDPDTFNILIGNTNYKETAEMLKDLKYYDYAIAIRGNKIVIAAYNESLLNKAVLHFRKYILSNVTKDEDGDYVISFEDMIHTGTYNVDSLTLDGNPIQDYVVVYGRDTHAGKDAAQAVVDVLASATGIYLPIVNDKETETACEILVGKTNRAESSGSNTIANLSYKVTLTAGKLVVDCHSFTTGEAALRKLYAEKMSEGGDIALTSGELCSGSVLTETEFPLTAGSDLRIVTYNVLKESYGGTETYARSEIFGAFLDVFKPDIVGVQEFCEKWAKYAPEFIGNYKIIGTKKPDGSVNYSAIVYDASKYDVVASGVIAYSYHSNAGCRNMAWAVFKNKTTGFEFAFISTHWDFGNETEKQQMRKVQAEEMTNRINSLKATYKCPVIITGDFNCTNTSDSYNYFMGINGMSNALTDAKYHYNAKGTSSIDFVMITKGDGVFNGYRKLEVNGLDTLSDHKANLADIDILSW